MNTLVIYTACFFIAAAECAHAELLFVYAVQRHGARNVLPKSFVLQETSEDGGPVLLPQGESQCFNVGSDFRARYIAPETCSETGTCLLPEATGTRYGVFGETDAGFNSLNVQSYSSGLVRTIMTAESFLTGIFPPDQKSTSIVSLPNNQQVVPVFVATDSEDYLIRGYTKCNAYQDRLKAWFDSPSFAALEAESAPLRERVATLDNGADVSLENWWNVYDELDVARTFGVGDGIPGLDNATFAEVKALADTYELAKMRPNLTGNLLGGAMLGDLLARLDAAVAGASIAPADSGDAGRLDAPPTAPYLRLVTYAGHYNTLLGLLSALQPDSGAGAAAVSLWPEPTIPALASVLVFELHRVADGAPGIGGGAFRVRAVYKDGDGAAFATVPLPCASAGAATGGLGSGSCTLDAFLAAARPQAMSTVAEWCAACGNTDVLACRVQQLEAARERAEAAAEERTRWDVDVAARGEGPDRELSNGEFGVMVAAIAVLGVLCAVLGGLLARSRIDHRPSMVPGAVQLHGGPYSGAV